MLIVFARIFASATFKNRPVLALLEAEGLSVYRDLTAFEGGGDWWRQIAAAIRSVEHVVLVLSQRQKPTTSVQILETSASI